MKGNNLNRFAEPVEALASSVSPAPECLMLGSGGIDTARELELLRADGLPEGA